MSSFTKLPSSSFPTTQGKLYALYYLTRRRINASFKPDLTTESPNHRLCKKNEITRATVRRN